MVLGRGIVSTLLALALTGCGGTSLERYASEVEQARACEPGDTCVLAGGQSVCTCAEPVNARRASEISEASEEVDCGGNTVTCIRHINVRCEIDRCTSDAQWVVR